MEKSTLWSLRLGFSARQSKLIEEKGINAFLMQSFATTPDLSIPSLLDGSPKSFADLKGIRKTLKANNPDEVKELVRKEIKVSIAMKSWWIEKMRSEELPLREKMTVFWHNHFVATYQKVKVNHWIYNHNSLLRENAFGNFRELTKKVLQSNAMVRYLDNTDNRNGKINENLSRELLELFTLGIGNYSEEDIKNGAKGLAGLGLGDEHAIYRSIFEDNDTISYLGKTGTFKADALVDIIFEQSAAPYLLTRKILKWFIYDNPDEKLVTYYGNYFREQDYEIKPLLVKIVTEEYAKDNAGSKIKDPLVYILQLIDELHIETPNTTLVAFFLKQQGMDLFNQPNVKGWNGGREWLSTQVFLQRNNAADLLCNGKNLRRQQVGEDSDMTEVNRSIINVRLDWDKNSNNKQVINTLRERLLFQTDPDFQADCEKLLKYDFNPHSESADNAVLRLFNFMVKTPEYQLI